MTEDTMRIKQEQEVDVTEAEIIEDDSTTPQKSWGERLTAPEHWLRCVFMVLFAVITGVAAYIMTALVVLQFIWALVTGESNDKLRHFGSSLSQYIYQILRFLTYNTEDKPFPFDDWPSSDLKDD